MVERHAMNWDRILDWICMMGKVFTNLVYLDLSFIFGFVYTLSKVHDIFGLKIMLTYESSYLLQLVEIYTYIFFLQQFVMFLVSRA